MNKIAIDIVLLPPPKIAEQAIAISNKLAKTSGNTKIVLDGDQYLPHISLCMGGIDENDLQIVHTILKDVIVDLPPFQLTISGIRAHNIPTGEQLAVLEIVHQDALQKLHETIMDRLRSHLSYDIDTSMFFGSPEVAPISVKWVKDFDQSQNSMTYYPHITSGFGEYADFTFPVEFIANTIAICHLGNYCTCRKILASFELQ
ncbi:MAG: hypothetical protein ABWX94_02435 [Candidatus Saccharimonadales bacterium]